MTDMTEHRDVDTVVDAAIRDAVTDTAAVTMITVEDAAAMTGVSVRTIRRWIQHGHLSHIEDENGKRVSPADLPLTKERARHGHGHGRGTRSAGHDRGHANMATDTDTAMTAPALSSATAQLEAIRDQWLRPLVDRIEELSRENGRLEAERDQAAQEQEALRVDFDRLQLAHEDAPRSTVQAPQSDTSGGWRWEAVGRVPEPEHRSWWRRLLGRSRK